MTTLIPAGAGSIITDALSTWSSTANAFDGTTNQSEANSAAAASHGAAPAGTNYIGKDWGVGVTKLVIQVTLYGPNNNSLLFGGGSTGTAHLDGSNDGTNWDQLASFSCNGGNAQVITVSGGSVTATTYYRYHRISAVASGSVGCAVAEIQFYSGDATTISISTASYAYTAIAAAVKTGKGLSAATASYAITGIAATLSYVQHLYMLTASAASYALTGVDAGVRSARRITMTAASYTFTGIACTVKAGKGLVAQTGTYAVTGVAAILAYSPIVQSAIRASRFVLQKLRTTDPTLDQ